MGQMREEGESRPLCFEDSPSPPRPVQLHCFDPPQNQETGQIKGGLPLCAHASVLISSVFSRASGLLKQPNGCSLRDKQMSDFRSFKRGFANYNTLNAAQKQPLIGRLNSQLRIKEKQGFKSRCTSKCCMCHLVETGRPRRHKSPILKTSNCVISGFSERNGDGRRLHGVQTFLRLEGIERGLDRARRAAHSSPEHHCDVKIKTLLRTPTGEVGGTERAQSGSTKRASFPIIFDTIVARGRGRFVLFKRAAAAEIWIAVEQTRSRSY